MRMTSDRSGQLRRTAAGAPWSRHKCHAALDAAITFWQCDEASQAVFSRAWPTYPLVPYMAQSSHLPAPGVELDCP